ncbi:DUF3558 domain-containing protein [Mycolicibacterium sp. 3033]|nr:DUF3558 domain-containing protein [Mycolicibacterium aurantiacum]
MSVTRALAGLGLALVVPWTLVACGGSSESVEPTEQAAATGGGFRSADCNGITDSDISAAAGPQLYTRAVVSDTGCFWQENTMIGDVGAGMGISTWWYRGSDMDTERDLEQQAGRTVTELSLDGNKGFKAFDDSACSIYVAKGSDVITWSIQTLNSQTLPDLCTIVGQLAQLSQERVN